MRLWCAKWQQSKKAKTEGSMKTSALKADLDAKAEAPAASSASKLSGKMKSLDEAFMRDGVLPLLVI